MNPNTQPVNQCPCGADLPFHIAAPPGGAFRNIRHICSCERVYQAFEGQFYPDGTAPNPFLQGQRREPE